MLPLTAPLNTANARRIKAIQVPEVAARGADLSGLGRTIDSMSREASRSQFVHWYNRTKLPASLQRRHGCPQRDPVHLWHGGNWPLAISLQERFLVQAPIDAVWRYLLDPYRVVGCMPGAELEEVVGDGSFLGSIKVSVGPITTSYKGRVRFTDVDEETHHIRLTAEGREGGGGTARGSMSSWMRTTEDGQTEVSVDVSVDITGRIVQIGRGFMQDVASDMFGQFVSCVKARLKSAEPAAEDEAAPVKPVAIVPLALRAIWSALVRLVRRILRRPARR